MESTYSTGTLISFGFAILVLLVVIGYIFYVQYNADIPVQPPSSIVVAIINKTKTSVTVKLSNGQYFVIAPENSKTLNTIRGTILTVNYENRVRDSITYRLVNPDTNMLYITMAGIGSSNSVYNNVTFANRSSTPIILGEIVNSQTFPQYTFQAGQYRRYVVMQHNSGWYISNMNGNILKTFKVLGGEPMRNIVFDGENVYIE